MLCDLCRERVCSALFFLPRLIRKLKHRSAILFLAFFFLLILYFSLITAVFAGDEPFIGPSNWGATGLMETPTARVMKEDTFRIGTGQVYPYRYYYGAMGLFKGLEIDGKVTEIIGVKSGLGSSYGDYKDKSIDLKYQFLSEDMYLPALALGIRDPTGNRLYTGQYLVASKQIYPFDFTLGFGNGRFGKSPSVTSPTDTFGAEILNHPREWARDAQPFWGIQFSPSEKYSLMMEYNPIKIQPADAGPCPAKVFYAARPPALQFRSSLEAARVDGSRPDLPAGQRDRAQPLDALRHRAAAHPHLQQAL